ncbi:MAG: peroxide stress protein YaaA [Lachnospirales bacterium]
MKIIISPAKKMNTDTDFIVAQNTPSLIKKTIELLKVIKNLSYLEMKKVWNCNESIADLNYKRFQDMELDKANTPAVLAYEGLQYQYISPSVFEKDEFAYIEKNLRILSGFYGVLKPMDRVTPYRLEMQSKIKIKNCSNLYSFWANSLYRSIVDEDNVIINLASKEYSKTIEKYLQPNDVFITINFVENVNDKLVTKGTYAKMARGEMLRFLAEHKIEDIEEIKKFNRLGYFYRDDLSNKNIFVFERIV